MQLTTHKGNSQAGTGPCEQQHTEPRSEADKICEFVGRVVHEQTCTELPTKEQAAQELAGFLFLDFSV